MRLSRAIHRLFWIVVGGAPAAFGANTFNIGALWVFDTSIPDTLQSQSLQISSDLTASGKLQYELGFSTREQADLGFLFDSLTLTIARGDGSNAASVATADVFGLTIAPLSPNGLLANGGIIAAETTSRIPPLNTATMSFAYDLEVSLPPELVGTELRATFSFFNNGDLVPTQAYAAVVPEPTPRWLIVFGCSFGWLWMHRNRNDRARA